MPRKLTVTTALIVALAICTFVALARSASPASADPQLDSEEQAFVTLINNYRAQNGLGPLSIDLEMQASSDWMSNDMGVNAYFSHTDSLGRDPWTRMCAFGYCYNTWMGENIAAGYNTAQSVFTAWQNSPGHNANMLGAHYTAMGISRVFTAGSPYGWYWTNDFGGVNSNAAPPGSATPTPAPTPTPSSTPKPILSPPPAQTRGDVDCNGFINAQDVIRLLEALGQMGRQQPSGCAPDLDVNCDGRVDAIDALEILLAISGEPAHLTSGCDSPSA
jgi:uncharacterized protein YkwD